MKVPNGQFDVPNRDTFRYQCLETQGAIIGAHGEKGQHNRERG